MTNNKPRVLITGGSGFIGSFLTENLAKRGNQVTVLVRKRASLKNLSSISSKIKIIEGDLFDKKQVIKSLENIDYVYHLAAKIAGVRFNMKHQAEMLSANISMGLNILESARINNIKKLLLVSSACVYPRECKIPTPESEGFVGDPEPTNFGYGWSKRVLEVAAKTYYLQYGLNISIVRPYNCYGPRDHFDDPEAHVIPALIKRAFSNENPFLIWGNGQATRSFLYVEDLVEGIMLAMEKGGLDPINLGTNEEISIKDLVKLILKISKKNPKLVFDKSKPSGQPRRNCDSTLAKKVLGFKAKTNLKEGLTKTINWYRKNYK